MNDRPPRRPRPPRQGRLLLLTAALAAALPLVVLAFRQVPFASAASRVLLAGAALLGLLWLLWRGLRAFLYKVGRRLAFSYFLIGVLPIPLVIFLLSVVAYILAGSLLGHLYRETVADAQAELAILARERLASFQRLGRPPAGEETADVAFGYYRGGRRVAGSPLAPADWPAWMEEAPAVRFLDRDGRATLGAAASRSGAGVVAVWAGNLEREIGRRADMWVEIDRPDDPNLVRLEILGREIPLRRLRKEQRAGEAEKFFKELSRGEGFPHRPVLWWAETSGPLLDPATGRRTLEHLTVTLNSTPAILQRHLFPGSGEVDSAAWLSLLTLAALLFDVYVLAALMAVFMIVGLSRAVNRLSRATAAVRAGDFGVRIPVRRRDQLGDLQRSFNAMAAHLQASVAAAAQKEVLDRELQIARNVQTSLIPSNLPAGEGVELSTLFEPSAAIGGDYFDVLRLSDTELAVVIADVSGHGLSTGLRMAMLKAALMILIEHTRDPEEILRRLDALVRHSEGRTFVTATLAIVDLAGGLLHLTNAGHPPTYRVRGAEVEEILLPGSPLGALGHDYGRATLPLEPGDLVVWLSDGLIEAADADGEPFGYERIEEALAGGKEGQSATQLRDRLLAAIGRHVGNLPPEDDRTLVVMRYRSSGALTGEIRLADLDSREAAGAAG